jgi:hypothetical protein
MGDGACLALALARLLTLSGSPQKGRHGPMPGVGGPALAVPRRAKQAPPFNKLALGKLECL